MHTLIPPTLGRVRPASPSANGSHTARSRRCPAILRRCVACGAAALAPVIASARAGTVALWTFDDPIGARSAADGSGNDRHLTVGPGAAIVSGGRFGNALEADGGRPDGVGAYRDRIDAPLNPAQKDWTLECWVKAKPGWEGDNRIWAIAGTNYIDVGRPGDAGRGLNVANIFLPASGKWGMPTGDLADGQWHHLAVVYRAGRGKLAHYFDGKRQYEADAPEWRAVPFDPKLESVFPPAYPQLQIGWRPAVQQWGEKELHGESGPPRRFRGWIDELRISDEAVYTTDFDSPKSLAQPFLRVWPRELSVVADPGKESADSVLTVSAVGNGMRWKASANQTWLRLSEADGTASERAGELRVSPDFSALKPGRHDAVIRFTPHGASAPPIEVNVRVTVPDPAGIRDVGDRRQLFVDRRFVARDENVRLTVNPPEKVAMEFPDPNSGALYPSGLFYLKDPKRWRMYYTALGQGMALKFVESEDGLKWTAPATHAAVHGPDAAPLTMASVMYDEHDAPARRFKAFNEIGGKAPPDRRGIYAFYSADGVRFTDAGRVLPMPAELFPNTYRDEKTGRYVAFLRVENFRQGMSNMQGTQVIVRPDGSADTVTPDRMMRPGFENARAIGRIETDDLLKPWPYNARGPSTGYTTAANLPIVLSAEPEDGFVDYYAAAVWRYPYADDVYLAFPAAFRHFHASRQPQFYRYADANGPIEVQLATSRDGVTWDRPTRGAYLATGTTNDRDRWLHMMGTGAVRNGDYLYQYYWSTGRLHDSLLLRPGLELKPDGGGTLFAARQRLDGFVSADVDHRGGSLTTPPVRFSGARLLLNHNCNATGTIYVELRDLNDVAIPGYRLEDCEEVTGNDTGWEVRWREPGGDVSPLNGKPVKLHFKMRNAKLYAFEFASAQTAAAP